MTPEQRLEIIARYLRHQPGSSDEYFDAVDEVDDLVNSDPATALTLVEELLSAASSAHTRSYIAAGPLENLIRRADRDLFSEIEAAAQRSSPLRAALSEVLVGEEVLPEIRQRLTTVYGAPDISQTSK